MTRPTPSIEQIEDAVRLARIEPLEAETYMSRRAQRMFAQSTWRQAKDARLREAYVAGYAQGNGDGMFYAYIVAGFFTVLGALSLL